MSNKKTEIKGNVSGGNVNIGGKQKVKGNTTVTMGDLSQSINSIPDASEEQKKELEALINQLSAALENIPAEHEKDASKVSKRVEELVQEVSEDDVDAEAVDSKANLLKKAAENIRDSLPVVAEIASHIVLHALKIIA